MLITVSAPSSRTSRNWPSSRPVATIRPAPSSRATWTASLPATPVPPCTSTVSPGTKPAAVVIDMPVMAVPSTVATAGSMPWGIGATALAATTVCSASAP